MIKIKQFLLFMFLFLGCTSLLFSNQKKIIKVGFSEVENIMEVREDGSLMGFGFEYFEEIKKFTNFDFEYILVKEDEIYNKLEDEEIDIFFPYLDSSFDLNSFTKRKIVSERGILYTKIENDNLFYDDFNYFDGLVIGYCDNDILNNLQNYARAHNFTYKTKYFENSENLYKALNKGEVNIIASYSFKKFEDVKVLSSFLGHTYSYVSKKDNFELYILDEADNNLKWIEPLFLSTLNKEYQNLIKYPNYTREEKEYIDRNEELKVGVFSSKMIHSNLVDLEVEGIDPEIVKALASLSGLNLKIQPLSNDINPIESIESNINDLFFGLCIKDSLNKNVEISEVVYKYPQVLAIRKNSSFDINNKQVIGLSSQYIHMSNNIKEIFPNWEIKEIGNFDELKYLKDYEVDCILISKYELQYKLQMPIYSDLTIFPQDIDWIDTAFFISPDLDPLVMSIINKSIYILNQNEVENIVLKNISEINYEYSFFDELYSHRYEYILISIIVIFVIVILLIFLKDSEKQRRKMTIMNNKLISSNKKLFEAEKEARKANNIKAQFLAQMSHDMRTPMNTVIGLSTLGLQENNDEKDYDYFGKIKNSSEYLLALLNDILDVQLIESKKLQLNPTFVKIGNIPDKINTIIRIKAKQKNIKYINKANCKIEKYDYVIIDERRIEQVLINLLNNAIKYTPEGGTVTWDNQFIKEEGSTVYIKHIISDTGVGISEEFQKNMYNPFTIDDNELRGKTHGTGLGLTIVKNIIDMMEGSITCESEIGKGTTFSVIIPIKVPTENQLKQFLQAQKTKNKDDCLEGKTVLICEDIEVNANILGSLLKKIGMKIEIANNGEVAVQKAKNNHYDLILMDIKMPIMDGLVATSKIREFDKDVIILALSANAYDSDKKKSIEKGMNDHLAKPIDIELLKSKMIEHLKKST